MKNTLSGEKNSYLSRNGEIELYVSDAKDFEAEQWHRAFEILMPISGSFHVLSNSNCFSLNANDICVIPCGILHQLVPISADSVCIHLCINPKLLFQIPQFLSFLNRYYPMVFFLHDEFSSKNHHLQEKLKRMIELIQNHHFSLYDAKLNVLLQDFFLTTYDCFISYDNILPSSRNHDAVYYINMIQSLCIYIRDNCTNSISLNSLPAEYTYSKPYLNHLFTQIIGISIIDYIIFQRLLFSLDLLTTTDLSTFEIMQSCGFQSISSFRRSFIHFFHESPSVYRKKYLQF